MSNIAKIQAIATPLDVQLRWSDQDINGHVNNVRILTYMEEARIRATKQWTDTTPGSSTSRRVVRALNTTFDREVHYGKAATVWVWIVHIGTSSFVLGHLLSQDGLPCAYTEATMVVLDAQMTTPVPHEAEFRRELEIHAGPAYSSK